MRHGYPTFQCQKQAKVQRCYTEKEQGRAGPKKVAVNLKKDGVGWLWEGVPENETGGEEKEYRSKNVGKCQREDNRGVSLSQGASSLLEYGKTQNGVSD